MSPGTVIVLNGASSSGKATLARALQDCLTEMYLHLETDYIFELMENAGYNGPVQLGEPVPSKLALGTAFIHDDWRFVRIEYGEYGVRAFRGFFPMVAALAAGGNHVLVDSFLTEPWIIQGAAASFSQIPAYFVGLRCPLDELERRERERGDRFPGIARAYADAVHAHVLFYDVEVDTAAQSADECARAILERVEEREPEAFKALCAKPGGGRA